MTVIFALHWAKSILIPLVLRGFLSLALNPIVKWLAKSHVPRALSAAVLLLSLIGAGAAFTYNLRDEAAAMLEKAPEALDQVHQLLERKRFEEGDVIENVKAVCQHVAHLRPLATLLDS